MITTRLSSALSSAVLGCAQARITNLLMNGLSHPFGDKPLPSTRICDIDIHIREGTNWPYTDEGRVLCSLSHAALHRRSVKQRRNRSSRLGGGFETNSNRVGELETGKRKSTEGTSRHKGNASFRLPPALIGARKTEVDPTSDIRTAETESFFDQTPLAATYLSKEKALECTQCFTVDPSYPLTGDVQSKRMWHSSEAGYKAREKLRIFGGYVCGQPRCESTRALDLLWDSHQPRIATCKNPTECRVTFALTTGLEADWPYTTTVWKQDGTQSTYYQCSACAMPSRSLLRLASSTRMQHFTIRRLTPAEKKKSYLGTMGPPPRPPSAFTTPNSVMRDLTLYGQPPSTVSDDKEFTSTDEELLALAGFGDDRDDEEE
ncbi:hypothetical protein J010_04782 [Cryptococcus neoformans]|nr:hypothetical protein C353_04880 [Cryptococcus neoformans var. grubii AD1-83a]OWZ52098.1 hypothetical protein C368_05139 [Cryptococcus neoformans var. grubii 125.91]OXG48090.1 hypothetical protein C355_04656 [Cryptococcus neoformans var. grubii Th84]OXG53728.1 hypothetical protein C354_04817 [Cryptococcus neoformans var. grubii MW-RSA1955]OXG57118.1 hypothetical protein C352_04797 [Cryptococcus neoformans var. grubii CHC193]OXG60509.1 hypothetical protein C351_04763 [Cryptococcus neoformans 